MTVISSVGVLLGVLLAEEDSVYGDPGAESGS